jgi:hypothetical protein
MRKVAIFESFTLVDNYEKITLDRRKSQEINSGGKRITLNARVTNRRMIAEPLGKEVEMAEDTTRKGTTRTGDERWPQKKPYSASMMYTDKTRAEIEKAAYYRWLNRGRPTGDDWTDWLQAEKDLKKK